MADDWFERYLEEQEEFAEKFKGTFEKAQEIVENGGSIVDIYTTMFSEEPDTGE
jgi:hypothetical protein